MNKRISLISDKTIGLDPHEGKWNILIKNYVTTWSQFLSRQSEKWQTLTLFARQLLALSIIRW